MRERVSRWGVGVVAWGVVVGVATGQGACASGTTTFGSADGGDAGGSVDSGGTKADGTTSGHDGGGSTTSSTSSTSATSTGASTSTSTASSGSSVSSSGSGNLDAATPVDSGIPDTGTTGLTPDSACAAMNYTAQPLPGAMLVVLDGSGTMAGTKWSDAQQAIVNAIDEMSFNTMSLGLLVYPTGNVPGPACIFHIPVACAVSGLAQVPLQVAGTNTSSDPTGVRHDIYQQLVTSTPAEGPGNGNPTYSALQSGIEILQNWTGTGVRILFYITDGGASCASVSSPTRPGYDDGNGCPDWEYPSSIISLVSAANTAATNPVNTIFVGVPGADTDGQNDNDPPYSVQLAMSAEAWAGSPQTCDPSCNGKTFTQTGAAPTMPCHFDMTTNYSATILAAAINSIRGSLLGCTYQLPTSSGGQPVNPNDVNVDYTSMGTTYDLARRANMSDPCTTAPGCWDYNAAGQVQLIGAACTAVQGDPNAQVEILAGCTTILN